MPLYRRLVSATRYSVAGLAAAWRHEAAFRLELILAACLLPVSAVVARSGLEFAVLVATLFVVLIAELVNTAIEAIVDRGGSQPDPLAARAKDAGSAAVFLSLVLVLVVWSTVLAARMLVG